MPLRKIKEKPESWITKKEKPKGWITKKEKPKSWITKKKNWITKKKPTDISDIGKKLRNALAGGIKGKPHSSPEGQAASAGRTIKRLGQRREDSLREIKPFKRKQAEIQTKLKSPEEYKAGGAVTRFRSSGPEGKPHSTKEGRSAEAQRAYMRKHGKPDKKRIQIRPKVSDRMQKLRDNLASVTGGEWGKKSGGRIGKEAPRQKKKSRNVFGASDEKIHKKPHATREGSWASIKRAAKRFKDKTYKIEDYGDKSLDTQWKAENKARKQKMAKGGRIGLQHGNRPRPQGPHTWVRKKPKGVKIAIKGW